MNHKKKFSKIFLHFGFDKTGSTAIQTLLSRQRDMFLSKGLLAYPPGNWHAEIGSVFSDHPENYIYNKLLGLNDVDLIRLNSEKYFLSIENWLNEIYSCDSLIFSYEGFADLDELALQRFLDFCRKWSNAVKVVVYVRPPLSYAVSGMSQRVKQGFSSLSDGHPPIPPYKNYLEKIVKVFGKNNLVVRIFRRENLINGDVIADFFNVIGLDLIYYDKSKVNFENESLSHFGLKIGDSLLSKLNSSNINHNIFHKKYGQFLSLVKGLPIKLTREQIDAVKKYSSENVSYLKNEFDLILTDVEDSVLITDSASSNEVFLEDVVDSISNMLASIIRHSNDVFDTEPGCFLNEFLGSDPRLRTKCGYVDGTRLICDRKGGFLIHGPYAKFAAGYYEARLSLSCESALTGAWMDVVSNGGKNCWARSDLPQPPFGGDVVLAFELTELCSDLEVRLWVPAGADVAVNSLRIEPVV